MFQYRAHGCTIESTAPIPDLPPIHFDTFPDLRIRFEATGASGGAKLPGEEPWFESPYRTADGTPVLSAVRDPLGGGCRIHYAGGPAFVMDEGGTTVRVDCRGASYEDACAYLLGPIIGIMLRKRGVLCLHASGVDVGGRACAFVGPAGAGKSTMAAAFAEAGWRVLSDDTLALRRHGAAWLAAPGYPRVRLWPEATAALGLQSAPAAAGRRTHLDIGALDRYATESLPLAVVYLIDYDDEGSRPRIDAVGSANALPELAANTFASRALTRRQHAGEFAALADLLAAVPTRRLLRPFGLERLGGVRDAVVNDLSVMLAV